MLAVRIPSYTAEVFSGALGYDLPTPLVPGPTCVGRVEEVAADVFQLRVGEVVLCNSYLSPGDIAGASDDILIGWTGNRTARSARMQQRWRRGSFAKKALYPASCLTPLRDADPIGDVGRMPFLASLAIADGG